MTDTAPALDVPRSAWSLRRPQFSGIHLDSAAAGRMATDVLDATAAQFRRESQVGAYVAEGETAEVIDAGHAQLGALLGVPPDGIAFVDSGTAALRALLSVRCSFEPAIVRKRQKRPLR